MGGFEAPTCKLIRVNPSYVLKVPITAPAQPNASPGHVAWYEDRFRRERIILENIKPHPRLVPFISWYRTGKEEGILMAQASHNNLQEVLDVTKALTGNEIPVNVRLRWCLQACGAVAHLHRQGVIHGNLRVESFLCHQLDLGHPGPVVLDLWITDLGCATADWLGVAGGYGRQAGFFDPSAAQIPSTRSDIFALGCILYSISAVQWPHKGAGSPPIATRQAYEEYAYYVNDLFAHQIFPDVRHLTFGWVMSKCWRGEYRSVDEMLEEMAYGINYQ